MQAFKLVTNHTVKYDHLVGSFIGDGADGDVYLIKDDPTKVIKFSVVYLWRGENPDDIILEKLTNLKLVQENSDLFAKLYKFEYIGKGERSIVGGKQDYLLFHSTMERCFKVTDDESKVFHSILSHEDNNLNKDFTIKKIIKMLDGLSFGLDFSKDKVVDFVKRIRLTKVKHADLHPRNIMKDSFGNFKLIDFDRVFVQS